MTLAEACKEAIYLNRLLNELSDISKCVILYNDNQSAQKLCLNPVLHKRSKHIDVRHHFIREMIENKIIVVKYLPTSDMPADIFTKGLNNVKHYKLLLILGIVKCGN